MPSAGLWDDIAAIAAVPIVVWMLGVGFGLAIERATGTRLPNALLAPLGFCLCVVVSLGAFSTGAGDWLAVPLVVAIALAGFVLKRAELPGRLHAGWPLLAALMTYVLFNASVIATGHWTLAGYNIENDSAYELVLIAHLQAHGTQAVAGPTSTANTVLSSYLSAGYPLGAQSLLAVVSGLLGVSAAVVWQGFISTMAAIAAAAAATLSGRTMDRRLAALAGFLAMAAALTYQFALQGAIKEIGVLTAVICALAVIRHAILHLRGVRAGLLVAVPLAAVLATYNAAGVPYVLALAGAGVLGVLLVHRRLQPKAWVRPAAIGALALAVLGLPALLTLRTFLRVAESGYTGSHPTAPTLGPLFRALPLSEISGVWLYGDYRLPVPPGSAGFWTVIASVVMVALLAPALLRTIAAREPGPLMGAIAMTVVLAVVAPRSVPYVQAKLLAIASPLLVLAAAQALSGARGWDWRGLCALVAAGLGTAVLASDALAYHAFPVAPASRLEALAQVGHRLGNRGPVLDSEFEQFAKYFSEPAQLIDGPDSPTPVGLQLLSEAPQYGHSFDLDQERLAFVESFPYVLTRRGPTSSRPPANFTLMYANAFYELWKREALPHVYAHLPLGEGLSAASAIRCRALGKLVAKAPAGARLALATVPPSYGYELEAASSRSPGWVADGEFPGAFRTAVPGRAQGTVRLASAGRYTVWVQGDLPRAVTVLVDGRSVGSAMGADTPGGWLSAGTVELRAGRHLLGLLRGGGGLGPGNGSTQASLGAVELVPAQSEQVSDVPLGSWRSLCGRQADWVELIG